MKNAIFGALVAVLVLGLGYGLGQWRSESGAQVLDAQGRGLVVPPKPRSKAPETGAAPLVYGGDSGGSAASNNGYMAVTGSYGVGTSVLYLIDTNNQQLVVYEARGGSQSMRRLVLVGARRIDYDLQLIDYNDESEFKRSDLVRMIQNGPRPAKAAAVTVPGDMGKRLGNGATSTPGEKQKTQKK